MNISGTTMNIDDLTIDGKSIKTLKSRLEAISADNAAAHNGIFRGKNLGTSITAAQIAAIRAGTFDDLYIGDYWKLPIDGTTTAIITGCGNAPRGSSLWGKMLPRNNLRLWLQNNDWVFPMNDTATTAGHLKGSKLYTETFPELLTKIKAVIPAEYIGTHTEAIANATDANGKPNHNVMEDMQMFLPSAVNLNIFDGRTAVHSNTAYSALSNYVWPYSVLFTFHGYVLLWLGATYSATQWYVKGPQGNYVNVYSANTSSGVVCWPYIFIG